MADQKNNQSNQNASPGQQSPSNPQDEPSTQQTPPRNDESTGWDESERERSSREPASTAHDGGLGEELESDDSAIEDLEDESSVSESDEEDIEGSSR
jgi:hypothetical protein